MILRLPWRQRQQAGSNSSQYQVAGDLTVVQGVTEERAREIAKDAARDEMASFSDEARVIGGVRIDTFIDRLIPILEESNRFEALRDPAIQMTLRRAELGAAATDDERDYDVLAELIASRIESAGDRASTTGIDLAVGVVDRLDPVALQALTVLSAVVRFTPIGGDIQSALASQEELFAQFVTLELPEGSGWIDHLDLLDLVRSGSGISTFKKAAGFFPSSRPGFVSQGVSDTDERIPDAIAKLNQLGFRVRPIPHELKPEYLRLPINSCSSLNAPQYGVPPGNVAAVADIANEVFRVEEVDASLSEPFMNKWREFPTLRKIADWWDQVPYGFQDTAVGKVLVDANLKRLNRVTIVNLDGESGLRSR